MALSSIKVVLLDRDGVINADSDEYIKSVEEWQPLPGSLEAIAQLHRAGFAVGIVTNQSGVGRGLLSAETLSDIHRHMLHQIENAGGFVKHIFFCPHAPSAGCECRKPKPGLLFAAAEYFACGVEHMVYVGDKPTDVQAARAAGVYPVLVRSGYGANTVANWQGDDLPDVCTDLAEFTTALLESKT